MATEFDFTLKGWDVSKRKKGKRKRWFNVCKDEIPHNVFESLETKADNDLFLRHLKQGKSVIVDGGNGYKLLVRSSHKSVMGTAIVESLFLRYGHITEITLTKGEIAINALMDDDYNIVEYNVTFPKGMEIECSSIVAACRSYEDILDEIGDRLLLWNKVKTESLKREIDTINERMRMQERKCESLLECVNRSLHR